VTENLPRRKSIRLPGFDYSQSGVYFVTICTHKHECIFGEIVDGVMVLNDLGERVSQKIQEMPQYYNVEIGSYSVMPNHIHFILVIGSTRGSTPTIGEYVKRLKTITSNKHQFWQRNYYEHIVRNESDNNRITEYIKNNPLNWENDKLYSP